MKLVPWLAASLGEAIMGGVQFAAIKSLVQDMESSTLSGVDKRTKVLEDFKAIGYELAGWIIETGLQLALVALRVA